MKIDLLYFDDCPSWQKALENLRAALKEEDLHYSIVPIEIKSEAEASAAKFLGSPSFQIDGQDLWPEERTAYSMSCRVYKTPEGFKGWPTVEMFRQKFIGIIKNEEQKP